MELQFARARSINGFNYQTAASKDFYYTIIERRKCKASCTTWSELNIRLLEASETFTTSNHCDTIEAEEAAQVFEDYFSN